MSTKTNLPQLSELHHSPDVAFRNDQFKLLLSQPPHESWVKKHPMTKMPYIPIDKVEFMLDRIFQEWRVEVLREGVMFNSIYVTVRIHYMNPLTGVWSYHDGVGAKDVQLNSGASAADLGSIKSSAVQMALPSAKTYAIKDACDHLGNLFGRSVNRKDAITSFSGAYMGAPTVTKQPNKSEEDLPL